MISPDMEKFIHIQKKRSVRKEELKDKISALELKIDVLITENTELRVKVAKMEERLIQNAKKSVSRKRKPSE